MDYGSATSTREHGGAELWLSALRSEIRIIGLGTLRSRRRRLA